MGLDLGGGDRQVGCGRATASILLELTKALVARGRPDGGADPNGNLTTFTAHFRRDVHNRGVDGRPVSDDVHIEF